MRAFYRHAIALCTLAALAACSGTATTNVLPQSQTEARVDPGTTVPYNFTTLDDPGAYSTVNQLLGINNEGHIVGYYGSGVPSDPSEGYSATPPYGAKNYQPVVYPMAADSIATCLNNTGMIAGYYVQGKSTYGFLLDEGIWWSYEDPHAQRKGSSTQIVSIADDGTAIGNYKSSYGSGAFELNVALEQYSAISPPQGDKVVATGINGTGDIVGYMTLSGSTVGFLLKDGTYTDFSYPGAASTQFLGVTAHDYIVGSFKDQSGNTHGFLLISPLWKRGTTWEQIDDPQAAGTTVVTSVNIHKALVGYYIDASGVTHGFMATPSSSKARNPNQT